MVALVDHIMKLNPVQPSYKSQIKIVSHYVLQNFADQYRNVDRVQLYSGRSISSHSDKIKGQGFMVWGNDLLRILDVHMQLQVIGLTAQKVVQLKPDQSLHHS